MNVPNVPHTPPDQDERRKKLKERESLLADLSAAMPKNTAQQEIARLSATSSLQSKSMEVMKTDIVRLRDALRTMIRVAEGRGDPADVEGSLARAKLLLGATDADYAGLTWIERDQLEKLKAPVLVDGGPQNH